MDPETEERLTKTIIDNAEAESILNREGDILPFGYYNTEKDGKLIWMCNEDAEGKITSVFSFDMGTHRDNKSDYLRNMDDARLVRDELVKGGWKKLQPPKVTFSYAGTDKPLSRKQKRYLKRKIQQVDKRDNPFRNDHSNDSNISSSEKDTLKQETALNDEK
uniref:Uncharacterized protein n=1 Tax=Marseillevirus LCMAC101 TaxID=2506602 RepID=A0A481YRB5_9VIRU|nr:MAG: hypothetical protein LCMAC101_00970 [Marseillevirus LCMAC101]